MKLPPGPANGLIGMKHVRRVQSSILDYMVELARDYGDAAYYRIANVQIFQFSHPDANQEITVTKNHAFRKPIHMRKVLSQWNGNGLVVNEGESWVRQRRLVNPAFKPQRVAGYLDIVVKRADALAARWAGVSSVEAASDLQRLTLGVVAEALFGADVERHTKEVLHAVAELNEAGVREMTSPFVLPMWLPIPSKRRLRDAVAVLDRVAREFIAERRRSGEDRGDLLSMMLLAEDDEGGTGRMNDEQARDESVNLLLGGNETTATAITWALHLLSRDLDVQTAARREVAEVTAGGALKAAHLLRLRLVEKIFKESMRMYPPAYLLPREASEDVQIGGFDVPRGATVQVALYVTHHDARWYPEPETFRPSRFDDEAALPKGAYLAFGAGPRGCIGRGFALMEGVAALATLLSRVEVRALDEKVELEAQVSLHPKGGLRLVSGAPVAVASA
jgi:cytochrome P450